MNGGGNPVVGSNEHEEIDDNVVDGGTHSHGEEEEERIYAHKESNRITEEVSLRITPLVVLGFVCCMCTLLVLLYFFYDQLGEFNLNSTVFENHRKSIIFQHCERSELHLHSKQVHQKCNFKHFG